MSANVGYATLQIVPSMKGVQRAMSSGIDGSAAGRAAGTSFASGFKSKVGNLAKIGAAAGASMAAGLAAAAPKILAQGSALEALEVKSKTVFGDGALKRVQKWASSNAASMGITATEATNLAASAGDLLKPMGFTSAEAAGMSTKLLDLSGALAAWSGGTRSAADVSGILTKALLGEREELKSLGISISEADVQRQLAQNGQKDLTGAALEQARALATQQLIMAKSTDAQAAWSNGSMNGIKAQNKMRASMSKIRETLVKALYPALAKMVPILQRGFEWIGNRIPSALSRMRGWLGRAGESLQTVGGFIMRYRAPIGAFVGVLGGFLIISKIVTAVKAFAVGIRLLTAAMVANPIFLIVTAIAALAAGLVLAYQKVDWFRAAVDAAWAWIKGAVDKYLVPAGQAIARAFVAAWARVKPVLEALWTGVKWAIGKVVWYFQNVWWPGVQLLAKAYVAAWKLAQPIIRAVWQVAQEVFGKVVWYFQNVWWPGVQLLWSALQTAWDLAKPVMRTVKEFITGRIDDVKWAFENVLKPAFDSMKTIFQTAWDVAAPVISTIVSTVSGLASAISGAFSAAKSAVTSGWNWIARAWNSSIGSFSFSIPGWVPVFGGKTFDMPNLPTIGLSGSSQGAGSISYFHRGGVVPGRPGADVPAVLQAGEMVLTGAQQARMFSVLDGAGKSDGSRSIGLNIENVSVADGADLEQRLERIEWRRRSVPARWTAVAS